MRLKLRMAALPTWDLAGVQKAGMQMHQAYAAQSLEQHNRMTGLEEQKHTPGARA